MAKHSGRKPHSIRHYVNLLLVVSLTVLILDLAISAVSISIVKQQSTRYLQDTAALYIDGINEDFAYITHYMGWTLANDESLNMMNAYRKNSAPFLKANEQLYKRFTELQRNYGDDYSFFFYLPNQDFFLNCAPMKLSLPDYRELQRQIVSYTGDKEVYEKYYSKWTPVLANGKHYIINIVPYHNRYLIGLISAEDLIRPLRQMDLGANGRAFLVDREGNDLTAAGSAPAAEGALLQGSAGERTVVSGEFSGGAFRAVMVIRFGTFEKIVIAQLLILLLFFLVVTAMSAVMLLTYRKVLAPVERFAERLRRADEDGDAADFGSGIAELEQAGEQFRDLAAQIKSYKIAMYEQELEKQRIQLDYMKLQIKPHFFLNCLTSIYSMAQMGMFREIEHMSMSTSKYFRYIFSSGQHFVRLKDEAEHVRIYLDIQRSRYRDAFSYTIDLDEAAAETPVPPLMLQTFIENAIKYAVSRDQELAIRLQAAADGTGGVRIVISDSGPGFPPDVLEKLESGRPLTEPDGRRIGIMNVLQRLGLLYGGGAKIHFANGEQGGARISIALPPTAREENHQGRDHADGSIAGG